MIHAAPLTIDRVVHCACSNAYLRVDVFAEGVSYLGANVHGSGGMQRMGTLARLRHRLVHASERPSGAEWPIRIYTRWGARKDEYVDIERSSLYLLHRTEPAPLTEADVGRMIFEVEGEPDVMGRQRFTSHWYRDRLRGQCFHAHLAEIATGARRDDFAPELWFKGKALS